MAPHFGNVRVQNKIDFSPQQYDLWTRRGLGHDIMVMQVFAQPIFETVERWIRDGKYSIADRPILMRAIVRCSYVAFTCIMSILIPFFGDLMGCVASFCQKLSF